ncbi:MAG: flagellar basal body P-ring formation chaperone FlgA [Pirellulaceae bacterium]
MQRILLYSTLLTLAAWSADAAEVRLKPEAVCSGAIVRLKDVAEIVSADENEAAALAELQLFPVPSAGKVRNVRRGEIRELLALSDVNLKAVTLSGAEKLVVRRAETHIASKPPATTAVVPTAYITPSTKLTHSGESAGVALVPVATRALQRGTVLRATDLELRPAAIQNGNSAVPPKIEDLVGKELLRPLSAGQQLFQELVQSPRLVHRNDKVTVKAVTAGVVVSTTGKALEEGGPGDNVLVEDMATKEKLVTRVTGYQVVEVLGTGVKSVR